MIHDTNFAVAAVIAAYCTSFFALLLICLFIGIRAGVRIIKTKQRLYASYQKESYHG